MYSLFGMKIKIGTTVVVLNLIILTYLQLFGDDALKIRFIRYLTVVNAFTFGVILYDSLINPARNNASSNRLGGGGGKVTFITRGESKSIRNSFFILFATVFHQVFNRPMTAFDSCGHCRSHPQRTMRFAEIVIREIERDRRFKIFQFLAECVG